MLEVKEMEDNYLFTHEQMEEARRKKEEREKENFHQFSEALDKEQEKANKMTEDALNGLVRRMKEEKERSYEMELKEAQMKAEQELKEKYQKDPVTEAFRNLAKSIDEANREQ